MNHKLYEVVCVGAVERDQAGSFEFPGSDSARRTRKKSSSFPGETSGERRRLEADVVRTFVVSGGCVLAGIPHHPSGPSPTLLLLKGCACEDTCELGF